MGLFEKMTEPVFLKEDSSSKEQLEYLKAALIEAPEDIKSQIEQDIRLLNAGIYGEEQIAFELRNSHIPMFILHDLYLTDGELSAQIDYLLITLKRCYIIECKNLFGNIEINSSGDFIRTMQYDGKIKKEGIYSPITQNQRHLELLKKIRRESKGNAITKALFNKIFYASYKPIVVLANPKTILNAKFAKKEIRDQVIRADQLVQYIKRVNAEWDMGESSVKDAEQRARYFLELHHEPQKNYLAKYQRQEGNSQNEFKDKSVERQSNNKPIEGIVICPKCGAPMVKRVAKRGSNAGKEFLGCSNYPKCKGVINLPEL